MLSLPLKGFCHKFGLFISCDKELLVSHLVQEEAIYYNPLYENSVYLYWKTPGGCGKYMTSVSFLIDFHLWEVYCQVLPQISIRDERSKILDNHFLPVYFLKLSQTVAIFLWFPLFFTSLYCREVFNRAVQGRKIVLFATYETSVRTSHNCIKDSCSSMFLTHIQLLIFCNLQICFFNTFFFFAFFIIFPLLPEAVMADRDTAQRSEQVVCSQAAPQSTWLCILV